jgi:hypothetical protein
VATGKRALASLRYLAPVLRTLIERHRRLADDRENRIQRCRCLLDALIGPQPSYQLKPPTGPCVECGLASANRRFRGEWQKHVHRLSDFGTQEPGG